MGALTLDKGVADLFSNSAIPSGPQSGINDVMSGMDWDFGMGDLLGDSANTMFDSLSGFGDSITGAFAKDGILNSSNLKGIGAVAGGIGSIMGAMGARDKLKQDEDRLQFSMDLANRNIQNQGQIVNNKIIGDSQRYLQDLRGNDDGQQGYLANQAAGKANAQGKLVNVSQV